MSKFAAFKFLIAIFAALTCVTVMPLAFSGANGFAMFACIAILMLLVAFCPIVKKQSDANGHLWRANIFVMHDRAMTFGKAAVYSSLCFFAMWLMSDEKSTVANRVSGIVAAFVAAAMIFLLIYLIFGRWGAKKFQNKNIIAVSAFFCTVFDLLSLVNSGAMKIISFVVFFAGISMFYCAMHAECKDVSKAMTAVFDVKDSDVKQLFALSDIKGAIIAFVFALAVFLIFGAFGLAEAAVVIARPIVCALFLFLSFLFALRQPLDLRTKAKTELLMSQGDPVVKASLANFLTNEKDRAGIRVLMFFVRPFCYCKAVGKENVPTDLRVVFIGNHYEIYGPVAAVCNTPFGFCPWIHANMLDDATLEDQLKPGIEKMPLPKFVKKRLPRLCKRFISYVMKAMHPVPVFRDDLRGVVKTIEASVRAMQEGDNVMVWPENSEGRRFNVNGVDKLFTGFVDVASVFYRQTGKETAFVPVYVSKKHHKMFFGNAIKFDVHANHSEEKRRIAQETYDALTAFAEQDKKHKER